MTHSVMVWPLVRHTFETFIGPLFLLKKKKKIGLESIEDYCYVMKKMDKEKRKIGVCV